MNGHVAENTTRHFDVFSWWRARIPRGDRYHFNVAHGAVINRSFHSHEVRVKPTVEAHHQSGALGLNGCDGLLHALYIQINRFFAEHSLTNLRELLDQVRMGIGRGTNHNRIDIIRGSNLVDSAQFAPEFLLGSFGGSLKRFGDCDQFGAVYRRNCAGMDLTNTASAKDSKT